MKRQPNRLSFDLLLVLHGKTGGGLDRPPVVNGSTTTSLCFKSSKLISQVVRRSCGHGSYYKELDSFI